MVIRFAARKRSCEREGYEYVLKNVKYLRQCCFFSWQMADNVIQEGLSGGGEFRHGVHA